jgi:hypothetical protein
MLSDERGRNCDRPLRSTNHPKITDQSAVKPGSSSGRRATGCHRALQCARRVYRGRPTEPRGRGSEKPLPLLPGTDGLYEQGRRGSLTVRQSRWPDQVRLPGVSVGPDLIVAPPDERDIRNGHRRFGQAEVRFPHVRRPSLCSSTKTYSLLPSRSRIML